MVEHRWLRTIGPGVVALGAVVAISSSAGAARDRPWAPFACAGGGVERVAAVRDRPGPALADLGSTAWMRLDPSLDVDGALVGQRLWVGIHERGSARVMDLPAESFAAGPFGRVVLVGADDGASSRLFTVDVATGCTSSVAEEADGHPARDDRPGRRHGLREPGRPSLAGGPGHLETTPRRVPAGVPGVGSAAGRRPASDGRGRPSSPGPWMAGRSRSSPAAKSPVGPASPAPTEEPHGPVSSTTHGWDRWSASPGHASSRTRPAAAFPAPSSPWTSIRGPGRRSPAPPDPPC